MIERAMMLERLVLATENAPGDAEIMVRYRNGLKLHDIEYQSTGIKVYDLQAAVRGDLGRLLDHRWPEADTPGLQELEEG